jgi:hypothetical protein
MAGTLPNGNYRASLATAAVSDAGGNALAAPFALDFFVLTGDVNRDRSVNGTDFALLAGNFGKTGMSYGQGDLNGDGAVNGSDFALLAGNFGTTVPAPPAQQAVRATAPPPAVVTTRRPPPARRVAPPPKRPAPAIRRTVSPARVR